jgi:hypothetical protein
MKKEIPYKTKTEHFHVKPVCYQWTTLEGTVHHGRSVVMSRSPGGLRQALKRFFITNSHVDLEEA